MMHRGLAGDVSLGASVVCRAPRVSRPLLVAAQAKKARGPMGFVKEDNSGKSNIFAVEPASLYVSSPRSAKLSRQGLGGSQGLLLVGGLIGAVLLVTLGIVRTPEDVDLFAGDTQESLRQIASQF